MYFTTIHALYYAFNQVISHYDFCPYEIGRSEQISLNIGLFIWMQVTYLTELFTCPVTHLQ